MVEQGKGTTDHVMPLTCVTAPDHPHSTDAVMFMALLFEKWLLIFGLKIWGIE